MMTIALGIYLVFLFLRINGNKPVPGQLSIQFHYENENDRSATGDFCDPILKECEPFLEICLSTEDPVDECNIYSAKTINFYTTKFTHQFTVDLRENIEKSIHLRVIAYDHDNYDSHDLIAEFSRFGISLENNKTLDENLYRVRPPSNQARHAKIRMVMKLQCNTNYYGHFCQKFCESSSDRYTCDSDGERICRSGYKGKLCSELDPCASQPCAAHATCRQDSEHPRNRKCFCGEPGGLERESAECYPDHNPCRDSPCLNEAKCLVHGRFNESFTCQCRENFEGHLCWRRRLACQEMARNITRDLRGLSEDFQLDDNDLQSVCYGNGECLEKVEAFGWSCKCHPGFSGEQCEMKVNNFLTMGLVIGLILLLTIVLILACCLVRHQRKMKLEKAGRRSIYSTSTGGGGNPTYITYRDGNMVRLMPTSSLTNTSPYYPTTTSVCYYDIDGGNVYSDADFNKSNNPLNQMVSIQNSDNLNFVKPPNRELPELPHRPKSNPYYEEK